MMNNVIVDYWIDFFFFDDDVVCDDDHPPLLLLECISNVLQVVRADLTHATRTEINPMPQGLFYPTI